MPSGSREPRPSTVRGRVATPWYGPPGTATGGRLSPGARGRPVACTWPLAVPPYPSLATTDAVTAPAADIAQEAEAPICPDAQPPQMKTSGSPSGSVAAAENVAVQGRTHEVGLAARLRPAGGRLATVRERRWVARPPRPSSAVTDTGTVLAPGGAEGTAHVAAP